MKRRILALSLCMALATPVTSLAYVKSPGNPSEMGKTQAELNGYSEETWAKLMDNTLEDRGLGKKFQCKYFLCME